LRSGINVLCGTCIAQYQIVADGLGRLSDAIDLNLSIGPGWI
jgi:hypothetical protein